MALFIGGNPNGGGLAIFLFILANFPFLVCGRQKVEEIIGVDVAEELLTTSTFPTTAEVTTPNATLNETEEDQFKKEEEAVLAQNPDLKPSTDQAYAVAWVDLGAEGYNESFTGEVRFLEDRKTGEIFLQAWFKGLNSSTKYQISIHEWGDLVWNDSCWGAGPLYKLRNDTDHAYFTYNFTTPEDLDDDTQVKFNLTTNLAPLWGDYSVIGRMVVVHQFFNRSDLETRNLTLRYAPDTSPSPMLMTTEQFLAAVTTSLATDPYENHTTPTSFMTTTTGGSGESSLDEEEVDGEVAIMIGCGPIGIGNANFSVVYVTSLGLRAMPSLAIMILVILTFKIMI